MVRGLAEKLRIPPPEALKILTLASLNYLPLLKPLRRTLSLTERLKSYVIPSMIKTASQNGLVSLSTPQINHSSQVIVVHKRPEINKWVGYNSTEEDYNVFINPVVKDGNSNKPEFEDAFEYCPSLPQFEAYCRRAKKIELRYMDLKQEEVTIDTDGFEARVIQHEVDHLYGYLMIMTPISFGRIKGKGEVEDDVSWFLGEIDKRRKEMNELYQKNLRFRKMIDSQKHPMEEAIDNFIMTKSLNAEAILRYTNTLGKRKYEIPNSHDSDYSDLLEEYSK